MLLCGNKFSIFVSRADGKVKSYLTFIVTSQKNDGKFGNNLS